jgi:steroid 5-alpha reductase family enzyme
VRLCVDACSSAWRLTVDGVGRRQNFFAELSQWWVYYLFSVAPSGVWLNWTMAGTALLTLLFQGSTAMTENLTARKYPAYAEYQRTTARLIPWTPGHPVWPADKPGKKSQ